VAKDLHKLYLLLNVFRMIKSRSMRWTGHAHMAQIRNAYKILFGKREGRRPFEIPRGWEDNTKLNLKRIDCECVDWIKQVHYRDHWRAFVNSAFGFHRRRGIL